jgi:crotonobetainyl-CoA:carnitine CoA-transferase CaiB-like acyl-CoA transferase
MTEPLAGVRLLDLSRFIAGPFCTMLLADLGADVVKVERPAGEDARQFEPHINGESVYLMNFNRNKRGITLDFRDAGDQDLLRRLAASSDIVVENFRAGTMEKMGCGWETLSALNPKLSMVRISGFGQDGPYAGRGAFDQIAQAMSGLMHMTGQADGPPTLSGTFLVDYVSGLYAAVGALSALRQREETGRGQVVDIALLDSAASLLVTALPEQELLGRATSRNGNRDRFAAPESAYQARDGAWVFISGGSDGLFERLVEALGRPDLLGDPRYATAASRLAHADDLDVVMEEWTMRMNADDVVAEMERVGVPCAKVATIADVLANPQLRHRDQIVEMLHPQAGRFVMHGRTVRLSDHDAARHRPAPMLGQHTAEVLEEWLQESPG